jgi:hypothetical protein
MNCATAISDQCQSPRAPDNASLGYPAIGGADALTETVAAPELEKVTAIDLRRIVSAVGRQASPAPRLNAVLEDMPIPPHLPGLKVAELSSQRQHRRSLKKLLR